MSLVTWLHGIIRGTKSPEKNGNTNESETPCGRSEAASSGKMPSIEDEKFARKLLNQAVDLISELESQGVPYAVVGGTAVMMQSNAAGLSEFRGTYDIDILVENQSHFAALASKRSEIAANLGIDDELTDDVLAMMENESEYESSESLPPEFSSSDEFAIGIDSVTSLNGYTLDTLHTERLSVAGKEVTVATCEQLLAMKEKTIRLLGANPAETSRPQDFIDIGTLKRIINKKELQAKLKNDNPQDETRGGKQTHAFRSDLRPDTGNKEHKPRR